MYGTLNFLNGMYVKDSTIQHVELCKFLFILVIAQFRLQFAIYTISIVFDVSNTSTIYRTHASSNLSFPAALSVAVPCSCSSMRWEAPPRPWWMGMSARRMDFPPRRRRLAGGSGEETAGEAGRTRSSVSMAPHLGLSPSRLDR